jgi:hypothetical protein
MLQSILNRRGCEIEAFFDTLKRTGGESLRCAANSFEKKQKREERRER